MIAAANRSPMAKSRMSASCSAMRSRTATGSRGDFLAATIQHLPRSLDADNPFSRSRDRNEHAAGSRRQLENRSVDPRGLVDIEPNVAALVVAADMVVEQAKILERIVRLRLRGRR